MARFLLNNGRTRKLLGPREPHINGATTLENTAARGASGAPIIGNLSSNAFARERFRHNSYCSDIAQACLPGYGDYGFELAIHAAGRHVGDK